MRCEFDSLWVSSLVAGKVTTLLSLDRLGGKARCVLQASPGLLYAPGMAQTSFCKAAGMIVLGFLMGLSHL